jgi:hypothetical protein
MGFHPFEYARIVEQWHKWALQPLNVEKMFAPRIKRRDWFRNQ